MKRPAAPGEPHCRTCRAPVLSLGGACAFCRTPVDPAGPDATPLAVVAFLERSLPDVIRRGRGLLGLGRSKDVTVITRTGYFRARVRAGGLALDPTLPPAEWVDRLVAALSLDATTDPDLRARLLRMGWALRA